MRDITEEYRREYIEACVNGPEEMMRLNGYHGRPSRFLGYVKRQLNGFRVYEFNTVADVVENYQTVVENETRGIVNSFMRSFGPPWEVRNAFGLFGSSCRITRVKGSVSEGGGFYVEDYTGRVAVTNSREVTKHFKESDSDIKAVHFYFDFIDTRTYPFVRRYFEPCLDITHLHLDRDGGFGEDHGGTPLSREVEEFLNDAFPQDGSVEKPVLEELLM